MRLHFALFVVCALATCACAGGTQPVAMPPPHDPNDYPNPYHVDEGWAKLGRKFPLAAIGGGAGTYGDGSLMAGVVRIRVACSVMRDGGPSC